MKSKEKKSFKYEPQITDWYKKKTKLKDPDELVLIEKYLEHNDYFPKIIKFSADYIFEFYDLDSDKSKQLSLRTESVFKLSVQKIINQFDEYFETINFDTKFEEPNLRESLNENKDLSECFKHDVQIILSKKNSNDNRKIMIIFEYFEKKYHDRIYDSYKEIKTKFNSDLYLVYDEKQEKHKKFNLYNTVKKFISDIFCCVCTLLNNKCILSKIIYFENLDQITNLESDSDTDLESKSNDSLIVKTNIFNYIMNSINSPNGKFDAKKLYRELSPYDADNEDIEYTYRDFIRTLKSKYKIPIEYNQDSNLYDSKYFSQIIINFNTNESDSIVEYKQIYHEFTNALDEASNKIIQFNKKLLEKNECFPRFLQYYIEHDLERNKDRSMLKKVYAKLKLIFEDDDNS